MINDTEESHRRMGMAAILMARDSGVSPIALIDQDETRAKDFPLWVTVWFLQQVNQMSPDELSVYLGLHPTELCRMLCQLEHIRSAQPKVDEWLARLAFTHTTMDGEAA